MAPDPSSKKLKKAPSFWSHTGPNVHPKSALTYISIPKSPVSPPRRRPKQPSRYVPHPEPGSLNARLRSRPESSLFTKPISWTDLHTSVLNVKFQQVTPDNAVAPSAGSEFAKATPMTREGFEMMQAELNGLWSGATPFFRKSPINTALQTMFGAPFQDSLDHQELHLWFGGKMYYAMSQVHLMWNWPGECVETSFHSEATNPADSFVVSTTIPSSPTPTLPESDQPIVPMMAHIHRKTLRTMRKYPFRISQAPDLKTNHPVVNLARLRGKILSPSNWDEDAYLVSVFISMAQRYFYSAKQKVNMASPTPSPPGPGGRPMTEFHDIKLRILTDDRPNSGEFTVYTTTATEAFLKQFHDPYKAFSEPSGEPAGMQITYTKLTYHPVETLRHRIGVALGTDIVGDLIITSPPRVPSPGLKRKRVLDDDDTAGQSERSASQSPKRQCVDGMPHPPEPACALTPPTYDEENNQAKPAKARPMVSPTRTPIHPSAQASG